MGKVISFDESGKFDIYTLRTDVASGKRPLRVTSHAQVEAFKDGLLLADSVDPNLRSQHPRMRVRSASKDASLLIKFDLLRLTLCF